MPATYEPIKSYTISGSTTGTLTFNSIPQTYTDLKLVGTSGQITAGGLQVRLNGISSSSYSNVRLDGDGSTISSGKNANLTRMQTYCFSVGNTISVQSILELFDYTNTSVYKSALFSEYKGAFVVNTVHLLRNTSAITSITLNAEVDYFVNGSVFTLYGIKAA